MKKIILFIASAFIIGLIPYSTTKGQEKKSEQKIKIIVADKSGTKIVLDTLIKDSPLADSINLKDGKVIFIGKNNENANFITKDGAEHIFVTVSSDTRDNEQVLKEYTIVSSDEATWNVEDVDADGDIFVYNKAEMDDDKSGGHKKIIAWTEKGDSTSGEKIIIMKDAKVIKNDDGKSFTYTIKTDVSDGKQSDYEKTKYVISKDGMVITIEGDDYDKVKELAKEIGGKIDAEKEISGKKSVKKK